MQIAQAAGYKAGEDLTANKGAMTHPSTFTWVAHEFLQWIKMNSSRRSCRYPFSTASFFWFTQHSSRSVSSSIFCCFDSSFYYLIPYYFIFVFVFSFTEYCENIFVHKDWYSRQTVNFVLYSFSIMILFYKLYFMFIEAVLADIDVSCCCQDPSMMIIIRILRSNRSGFDLFSSFFVQDSFFQLDRQSLGLVFGHWSSYDALLRDWNSTCEFSQHIFVLLFSPLFLHLYCIGLDCFSF